MVAKLAVFSSLIALLLASPGCGDDARRPVGAVCSAAGQCESGICGGDRCLDPAGDEDLDGLINATEAALRTDPVVGDTDGDGVFDAEEVGSDTTAPLDADGDGKIDAIESLLEDCDDDGVVDQLDPTDGANADGTCGGGTIKTDACPELCTATGLLGCEGFEQRGCVSECRELGAPFVDAGCGAEWLALTTCVAGTEGLLCAPAEDGTQLPELPDDACDAENTSILLCGADCEPSEPLTLGVAASGQLPAGGKRAFVVPVTQGGTFIVTVGPTAADDDPALAVFEDEQDRCAYEVGTVDVTPLYAGDEQPAGQPEATSVVASGDALVVLVEAQAGAPLGFTLTVAASSATPR